MALAGRLTDHHAMMCRLHRDRIKMSGDAAADLDARIAPLAARYAREAELLKTLPGFGDVVVAGGRARSAPPRTSTSPPPSGWPAGRPSARAAT
jgi:hypothetical protein